MAKDPAVLFYTSDFISGTITMSDAQRGQYILLLCLQHQKGFLTEKDMLNICKTYDEDIWSKFVKEGNKFYNKRMKEETEKRVKYSESRRNNRVKKDEHTKDINIISKTYDKHMENENINVNIIKDKYNNDELKKKYNEYTTHLLGDMVSERLCMNAPVKITKQQSKMVIQEFIDTCYGEMVLKPTRQTVEQYFINWVKKEGRVNEAINNQFRKNGNRKNTATSS
jgi:uncharacterized protein YdaU (DUF1376 family)